MDNKRKRSANYTSEEKWILLGCVGLYENIIECKTTDSATNKSKTEAWESVAQNYNSRSTAPRSARQLKLLYENIKRIQRKEIATKKRQNDQAKLDESAVPETKKVTPIDKDELRKTYESVVSESERVAATAEMVKIGGSHHTPILSNESARLLSTIADQVTPLTNLKCEYFKAKMNLIRLQRRLYIKDDERKEAEEQRRQREHELKIKILEKQLNS